MSIIAKVESTPDIEPESPPVLEIVDNPKYYKLSKPIEVVNKRFETILVDSSELSGTTYFKLVDRFRKEYPEVYRSSFNKLAEERFLSYVIAELNPPMTVEDVAKISFVDLPILFISAQSFIFGARDKDQATKE